MACACRTLIKDFGLRCCLTSACTPRTSTTHVCIHMHLSWLGLAAPRQDRDPPPDRHVSSRRWGGHRSKLIGPPCECLRLCATDRSAGPTRGTRDDASASEAADAGGGQLGRLDSCCQCRMLAPPAFDHQTSQRAQSRTELTARSTQFMICTLRQQLNRSHRERAPQASSPSPERAQLRRSICVEKRAPSAVAG